MRYVLILISLTFTLNIYSKNEKINSDKVVSLVTTGYGNTKDEAKQMALRDALEQAFGVFISTNTKISNDEIIKVSHIWSFKLLVSSLITVLIDVSSISNCSFILRQSFKNFN